MNRDLSGNTSLAAEAYAILRERILRGDLTIGAVVSRRKLATELGMSFLPVSEAMLRLEFEGLLESRPRVGTRVRVPTVEDVTGHYVVREALESQAARLFATAATAEEKAELKKLAARVDGMRSQPEGDRHHYVTLHERLHKRIAACACCEALSDAIEKTHALSSTWRCAVLPTEGGEPRRTHQDLLDVLSGGDPEAAAEAMRRHVQSSLSHALESLQPWFVQNRGRAGSLRSARVRQMPNPAELHPEAVGM